MTIHRISETNKPQFPCYMWQPQKAAWRRYSYADERTQSLCTHWSPDAPSAPSAEPTTTPRPDGQAELNWKEVARKLWMLLDDIDTQDDASKGNDAHFRKCAYEIQQKRHAIVSGEVVTTATPQAAAAGEAPWTQTPPTEQGTYWHWNGDDDSAPVPIFVLYSGTSGKCFVSMGQLGMDHATDCDEYGGWWKPLPDPKTPPQLELDAIRKHSLAGQPGKGADTVALKGHTLGFQGYEVAILQDALYELKQKEYRSCKWEKQETGQFYYTPNRKVKQIEFIARSITRQLDAARSPASNDKEQT
jgi:hypothetical protein